MEQQFDVKNLSFSSAGITCRGRLYLPLQPNRGLACVVMANGFSGTMDWILPSFAEAFSSNGFAVFIFDYRHLGESEGEPRQLIDSDKQLTDLINAIEFVKKQNMIDNRKIALWGTSLGGSYVFKIAAEDECIAAVIGNMPAIDTISGSNVKAKMEKAGVGIPSFIISTIQLLGAAVIDSIKGFFGLKPFYIKVYGKPGKAFFTDPALASRFESVAEKSATWQNKVTPRFLFHAPRYREGTFERIKAPILLTLATDDVELSVPFIKEKAQHASLVKIIEYPSGHFDLYHGEMLKTVLADQINFLKSHLG